MDEEKLLKSLKEHNVRFVVIGAAAFPAHGYCRTTQDIDIFIKPTRCNADKCRRALSQFGYDVTDISVDDLLTKKVLLRDYSVETDIHPFVKAVNFETVWKNKVKRKFADFFVWFASLDDLIKMKKAAGRAKDLEDLRYLKKLQQRKKKPN